MDIGVQEIRKRSRKIRRKIYQNVTSKYFVCKFQVVSSVWFFVQLAQS